jgi:hypothetical protein
VGKFEVDARGARIIGIGELHAGRQHRGGDIAVGAQPAVRAVVRRWARVLGTRTPHRQCWLSAVDRVPARFSRPPVAAHSRAIAVTSMPGLNTAIRLPHLRAQLEIRQSSTVMVLPWAATIRTATCRARACLARLVLRDAAA